MITESIKQVQQIVTLSEDCEAYNEFKEAFKSSIFLLIKYTVLEQMSRKISQINFSFIQHLYVGDDLYINDYEQISSVCHGFRFDRGRREDWS